MPLRVVTILDGHEDYGLPKVVGHLLDAMDRSRVHTIGLFFGRGTGYDLLAPRFVETHCLEVGPLFPLRRAGGVKYNPFFLAGRGVVLCKILRRLARWRDQHAVDLVHTHGTPYARIAAFAWRGTDTKILWHCHGSYPYAGLRSRQFERWARKRLAAIVAISQFVADSTPESLRPMTHVVHNAVAVEELQRSGVRGEFRRRYGLSADQPLIGIFGAVTPIKGHPWFLEAAALVAREIPEARFAIVGGTTPAYEKFGMLDDLRRRIHSLDLKDHVIETGFLPDATRLMPDFDIITMPSIWTPTQRGEGFGMVMAEAMAQGIATIATKCGAPPEVIEHAVNGLLVPPKDAAALAGAMMELLRHPQLRQRIGVAGARTMAERFDSRVAAARLEALYARVAGRELE